ncbi:MAG TPA: response regulator [Candidatus Desulfaltia sp.]|nr:response regulator [Candidatus Desulfaltia sp.]
MTPKKRILVVDDELDFVKMLQARLRIEGYEVLTAEDGIKGIQVARKEKPDLIILDIMMPGLDGHSLCDMLKKSTLTWSIPVIYLTAKTGQADELMAMEKGAKYYLTKPYNPAMLMEMIKSALIENEAAGERGGRVLVIDQDISFADDCEARLKQAGYDVVLAPTAAEGLQAARDRHPDIILLDYQTSHDDTHAGIRVISHDDVLKDIPLFILAPQAVKDRVDPKTADPDKFIVKPVNYPLLLDALQRTLKIKRNRG